MRDTKHRYPALALSCALAPLALCSPALAHTGSVPQEPKSAAPQQSVKVLAALGSEARCAELRLRARTDGVDAIRAGFLQDVERLRQALSEAPQGATQPLEAALANLEALASELKIGAPVEVPSVALAEQRARARDEVREIVRHALFTGTESQLLELGRAIEGELAEITLEAQHPASLLSTRNKPLDFLQRCAPERALAVALQLLDRPGSGWSNAVDQSLNRERLGRDGALRDPDGGVAALPYEFFARIVTDTDIPAARRAEYVLPFLEAKIDTELVRRAARDLNEFVSGSSRFRIPRLAWWHEELLADPDAELRRAGAAARLASNVDLALLERLASDADVRVRALVPDGLHAAVALESETPATHAELWRRLLADHAEVRRACYEALARRFGDSGSLPLPPTEFAELLRRLDDPLEQRLASSLLERLPNALNVVARQSSREARSEVCLTLLNSKINRLRSWAVDQLPWVLDDRVLLRSILTRLTPSDLADSGVQSRVQSALSNVSRWEVADRVSLYADLARVDGYSDTQLRDLLSDVKRDDPRMTLDALAPSEAIQVLLRSVRVSPYITASFLSGTDWSRARAELTRARSFAAASRMEQAAIDVALATLADGEPNVVATLVAMATALAGERERAEDLALFSMWCERALTKRPAQRLAVLRAFLDTAALPTGMFDYWRWLPAAPESLPAEDLHAALDVMQRRAFAAPKGGVPPFAYLAEGCLAAMERDPTLFRAGLVVRWSESASNIVAAVAATQRAGRADVLAELRAVAAARLNAADPNSIQGAMDALMAIPGEETAQLLVDYAGATNMQSARESALERLETLGKVRELGGRLRSLSTLSATTESAIAEVVRLLDDAQEAVRIEAIRGLATLGAVEHLPRLIRIVGSGTEAERTAARAALDVLHQRATEAAK